MKELRLHTMLYTNRELTKCLTRKKLHLQYKPKFRTNVQQNYDRRLLRLDMSCR